jgi:hypothetical protein
MPMALTGTTAGRHMVMAAMPLHTMVVMLDLTTAGIDRLITLRHIMVRGASFGQHMLTMGLATAGMAIAGDRHKLRIAVENAVDRHGVFLWLSSFDRAIIRDVAIVRRCTAAVPNFSIFSSLA